MGYAGSVDFGFEKGFEHEISVLIVVAPVNRGDGWSAWITTAFCPGLGLRETPMKLSL